jgi:hypothetical protein
MTHNLGPWRDLSFLDWQVHYCKEKRARMTLDVHCKRQKFLSNCFRPLQMGYLQIKRNKLSLGMVKPNSQQLPEMNWLFQQQRSFTFAANHDQQSSWKNSGQLSMAMIVKRGWGR